jgi:hypothetical protein
MNRLRLAAWATVAGLGVVSGCASPCGPGCGRLGLFHHRQPECCPPPCAAGACPGCEGPILGDGGPVPGGEFPIDAGSGNFIVPQPGPIQPGPVGPPSTLPPGAIPVPPLPPPDRLAPIPQATPVPANPSSRVR